jgi:predicted dienelactone hydrolase
MTEPTLSRRIGKAIAILTVSGVLATIVLVVSLWLERRADLRLPAPTGPLAVGRVTAVWVDTSTADTLSPVAGSKRELLLWFWYPAASGRALSPATNDYVPAQMRAAAGPSGGVLSFLTRDASKVHGHSTDNADVSTQQRSYPVAILRGGASAGVVNYTTLAEDLASHGYIVVGIDAPYRTNIVVFPDGRVVRRTPENNPERCDGAEKLRCFNRLLTASGHLRTFVRRITSGTVLSR